MKQKEDKNAKVVCADCDKPLNECTCEKAKEGKVYGDPTAEISW